MTPPTRARRSIADKVNSSDDEPAHRRIATGQSKGPESKHSNPEPPVSEADIAPISKANNPARPEPQSYLLQRIKQQVVEKHEKPVRDEYYEKMKALGGRKGAQSAHAGAWDRKSLEETARLDVEAGLKAAQPAITKDMKPYEDLISSEYHLRTERAVEINGLSLKFTRAEVTEARETWEARRTSLGLPIDGDCEDLTAPEPVSRRDQGNGLNDWEFFFSRD